jgi:peptidoglycan/LPS O-acetylase OafA/YrhL
LKYRAEIDGLRALAVVPVILFHAGFELFSGGFVGVDVFFVISGYLITTILIEDIENKRYSIVNFYERRARRILPALFFVMFVCIPFAWMWLLPSQMKDFSKSLVAVSLFASNILFWRESGYFAAAAEEKPLLHTWSLAVEEQYYVLFPVFLILAWRFGKNRVFWMIVVTAAISLLLSEWGWRDKVSANFYLAPTRAWELFSGSIAAFIVQKNGVQKNNTLALLGLAAIIFSIFAYDKMTPFPSVYALVPVLGVVLLVLYADKETLAAKLLSTKYFVGIGLISYSAYLWHQPMFAFARIRSLEHPSHTLMLTLSLMSLVLAYLSWKYVEKPFRKRGDLNRVIIFGFSTLGLVTFITFGLFGSLNNGIPDRLGKEVVGRHNNIKDMIAERMQLIKSGVCQFNEKGKYKELNAFIEHWDCTEGRNSQYKIAVFGDSHAADKAVSLLLNDIELTRLGGAGCNLNPFGFQKYSYCLPLIKRFEKEVSENRYDLVIIANRFDSPGELDRSDIKATLSYWSALSDNIILFSPMVEFTKFGDTYIRGGIATLEAPNDSMSVDFYKALEELNIPENVHIINTKEIFCGITNGGCFPIKDGEPLLTDYGHLSKAGAYEFGFQLIKRGLLN